MKLYYKSVHSSLYLDLIAKNMAKNITSFFLKYIHYHTSMNINELEMIGNFTEHSIK